MFFEKLCTLNVQNCVYSINKIKIFESLDNKYTKLRIFFASLDIECIDLTLSVICEEKCLHIKKL